MIKPTVGAIVGPTDAVHWGQVIMLPTAYGVLEIEDIHGNARSYGVDILTKLTDMLHVSPENSASLEAVASHFDPRVKTLILLVPQKKTIHIVVRGDGIVYVKRADKFAKLLDGDGAISGDLQDHDTIIAISRNFAQAFSQKEIVAVFDHLDAVAVSEKLTVLLHKKEEGMGGAGLVFQVVNVFQNTEISPIIATDEDEKSVMLKAPSTMRFRLHRLLRRGLAPGAPMRAIRKLRHPRQALRSLTGESQRTMKIVTILLGCLFGLSVILGIVKQATNSKLQKVHATLSSAQLAFDEGVSLLTLSPIKARDKLREAQELLMGVAPLISSRSPEGRQIGKLREQIGDNLTQALQVYTSEPTIFYDVSLLKKGGIANHVSVQSDTLAILDRGTATAYSVSLTAKSGAIVAGGSPYKGASLISMHGDSVYILVEDGIHRARISDKKTTPLVVKKDAQWGVIGALVSYGGNVYLLDMQKSRVWKYIATDAESAVGGFSEIHEYLNLDTFSDFSHATGMAIDGSVWVGTSDGKILRFTQGKVNPFLPKGVDPVLGQTLTVYTDDETKYLYVLDSQNKRVVVLEKEGGYVAQYVWTGDLSPTQIAVSESHKKILLLAQGKIYSIELR